MVKYIKKNKTDYNHKIYKEKDETSLKNEILGNDNEASQKIKDLDDELNILEEKYKAENNEKPFKSSIEIQKKDKNFDISFIRKLKKNQRHKFQKYFFIFIRGIYWNKFNK